MTTYAKIRTDAIVLNPVVPASVPESNALFCNSADGNALSNRTNSGSLAPMAQQQDVFLKKQMQCFAPIGLGKPISKRSDGRIVEADADAIGTQQFIGISLEAFSSANDLGMVLLTAPNAPNVLTGLGFSPGDEIYIGETTGGYIKAENLSGFTGNDDSIIKVGVADCPSGTAITQATDLILISQVIARP